MLKRVIERWEADGTIDVSTADRLKGSYTVRSFEYELNDERIASVGAAGANVEHRLDTHVQSFFRIVSYVHNAFF